MRLQSIFFFILLLCVSALYAQEVAFLECHYTETFRDNLDKKDIIHQDEMVLRIGKTSSEFFSLWRRGRDHVTDSLSSKGASLNDIMAARAAAIYDFNKIFPELFRKISGTDMELEIKYQPSWSDMTEKDEIVSYLESTEERDLKMSCTTSGIHRDRFSVMYGGIPFSSIGSTGQIRLCSLLFRISESIYFSRMTGRKPVILLDDVLLELDDRKRSLLLSELSGYSQAFYTFLPREKYFDEGKKADFFAVENGRFSLI